MKRLIAVACLALSLSACGSSGSDYTDPEQNPTPADVQNYQKGLGYDEFYTIEIDGVKCVVYNGSNKGGIFCLPGAVPSPSY